MAARGAGRPAPDRRARGEEPPRDEGLLAADAPEPPAEARVRVTPSLLQRIAEAGQSLTGALEALEATVALLQNAAEDVLALGRRAAELRADLRVLLRADDPDFVYFVETRGRGVYLRASPIDVSAIVRDLLLDRLTGTVLTSATLAVDGSFEYIKSRLGIGEAMEVSVPSEFDYGRQAVLYLPRRLPDPRSPAFAAAAAREILAILTRTRGRAFVLFTSYANLREVERVVAVRAAVPRAGAGLGAPLRAPARLPPHAQRGAARHVELLAGRGRRRRGAELRHHRQAAVRLAGRPGHRGAHRGHRRGRRLAVRRLPGPPGDPDPAAGPGRLIRHRTDRGVLAILDPRLRTMGYGQRFLASMPPAPVTDRLDDVARFFETPSP